MTEETKKESSSPEKLLIDDPSNFQYHVAYLTYSEVYDKTTNPEARQKLNESITALQQNQIDVQTFYEKISQYRGQDSGQYHYGRALIKGQKKREWRRKTQKHERIERHRK